VAGAACGSAGGTPPALDADVPDLEPPSPQRPPRGAAALEAWLAEGHYRAWHCEPGISNPRLTGNHGRHRICSNDALLASTSGPYPIGAASVKELYTTTDAPNGFAVGLKVTDGDGGHTWYWYERRQPGTTPLADGTGVPDCAVCHQLAERDYIFFRAP
jgi:hypothetical protein